MKLVRFLLMPALAALLGDAVYAQPGYGPMMRASYAQPTPAPAVNGAAMPAPMPQPAGPTPAAPMPIDAAPMPNGPMPPGAMQPGPVFSDDVTSEFGGEEVMEEYYGNGRGFRLFGSRGMFRQRTSRAYFTADAMLLDRNDATAKNINIQAPVAPSLAPASAFNRPFIRSFDPDFNYETAPRLTFGYVFMNDLAIEGTAFYKDDFDAVYNAYAPNGTLYATFFGVQPGIEPPNPPDSNWSDANMQSLRLATGIHNYEINIVETSRVFNFIAGVRYMEVRDRATIQTFDSSGPAPGTDTASIGTYNRLLGTQFGFRTGGFWRLLGWELQAKGGYAFNDAQSRVQISNNGPGTGGARNSPRFGGQNDAFVSDMRVMLSYRALPSLALRAGYECLFICNTALAVDQIDDTPTASLNRTGTFMNDKGDLFFHGPFAGAEFRF